MMSMGVKAAVRIQKVFQHSIQITSCFWVRFRAWVGSGMIKFVLHNCLSPFLSQNYMRINLNNESLSTFASISIDINNEC